MIGRDVNWSKNENVRDFHIDATNYQNYLYESYRMVYTNVLNVYSLQYKNFFIFLRSFHFIVCLCVRYVWKEESVPSCFFVS